MKDNQQPVKGRTASMWSFLFIAGIGLLTASDQFTKYLASFYLKDTEGITLIPGVLKLQYLENRGMAFGMLQGKQVFLILICIIFLGAAVLLFFRVPKNSYYVPLITVTAVLAGGAAGNLIDRILRGYVVDFIYFSLIDFPIFNIADCCVVIGGILMLLNVLVFYRNEEYEFLKRKP